MPRISTYGLDDFLTGGEKLLITDVGGATENILLSQVSDYVLSNFTETDPVFSASPAGGITSVDISNWNVAFGWGNHNVQGYLTSVDISDINATGTPSDLTFLRGDGQWVSGANETASSIKTKYESNPDTNAFTDAYQATLNKLDLSNSVNGNVAIVDINTNVVLRPLLISDVSDYVAPITLGNGDQSIGTQQRTVDIGSGGSFRFTWFDSAPVFQIDSELVQINRIRSIGGVAPYTDPIQVDSPFKLAQHVTSNVSGGLPSGGEINFNGSSLEVFNGSSWIDLSENLSNSDINITASDRTINLSGVTSALNIENGSGSDVTRFTKSGLEITQLSNIGSVNEPMNFASPFNIFNGGTGGSTTVTNPSEGTIIWDAPTEELRLFHDGGWLVMNASASGNVDFVSNVATNTILGRNDVGTGNSEELTPAEVRAMLNVEDGAAVDQIAADVPVGLIPLNYSASSADVEAHLVGIDSALAAVGGGITAENQRKIDNARDFFIQYHTASVVTIDSVASYITYQTANDENKKIINSVEATNNVDYLLTNVGSIGQTVIIDNDGSGTVRLIADDTETFIGEGNTGENFSASENAATIPQYSRVIATKKKANLWRVDGVYNTSTVDVSAPTVTSATVENANPNQLVVVFNKAVNAANVTGLSLDGSWTGITVSSIVSGNGTSTVTFGLSASIASGESGNFVYSSSNTITSVDFGKQLAAGSTAVTNNVSNGTELHTDSNAASPAGVTEANTTTGWTNIGGTFTSSTENVDFGSYSFKHVAGQANGHNFQRNFAVTAGKTYELNVRAIQTVGTSAIIHSPNDGTLGSDTLSFRPISEGVWADHVYTFTCSTSGNLTIAFYSANGGSAGDTIFVDKISFKELP